jgi:hypothetical protein
MPGGNRTRRSHRAAHEKRNASGAESGAGGKSEEQGCCIHATLTLL